MLMNIINRFAVPVIQIAELLAYYSKNYSRIFCPGLAITENTGITGITGNTGITKNTGITAITGNTGVTANTGITGNTGITANTGNTAITSNTAITANTYRCVIDVLLHDIRMIYMNRDSYIKE